LTQPRVRDLLAGAIARLRAAGVADPARDARKLLSEAMNSLVPGPDDAVSPGAATLYETMIAKRELRQPVSHILGYRAFWGRRFIVGPDVLDPRPETEILVELALREPFSRGLDLGTGSGAILLSLLAERPEAMGVGTDLSKAALRVAGQNATALGVDRRVEFRRADWFSGVEGQFDLIVANPPYIARAEMDTLQRELSFEPRGALTDEGDGLSAYRQIAKGVAAHLAPCGRLLVEIGPTQASDVMAQFTAAGLEEVTVVPDLDGRDRVVAARAA